MEKELLVIIKYIDDFKYYSLNRQTEMFTENKNPTFLKKTYAKI